MKMWKLKMTEFGQVEAEILPKTKLQSFFCGHGVFLWNKTTDMIKVLTWID